MVSVHKRSGSEFFQARISVAGVERRLSTGKKNKGEALEEAKRLEASENAALVQVNDVFLLKAGDRFFAEKTLAPKTVRGYEHSLLRIYEILGDFPLRALTVERVAYYVNKRMMRTGQPQLLQDLRFLSSLLSTAWFWNCGLERNVAKDFPKSGIRGPKERNNWIKVEELERVLKACPTEKHRVFVILAAMTGLRHQELVKLHWDEVDLKERMITLKGDRTKNKTGRSVPLSEIAYSTLCGTPVSQRVGWVFPGRKRGRPINHFGKAWSGIRRRAKLPDLRIHDLRHTFASWWMQRGGSELALQDTLGHKTRSMTRRYAHSSNDSLKQAVTVLDGVTLYGTRATN